jgi:hypothetical protein
MKRKIVELHTPKIAIPSEPLHNTVVTVTVEKLDLQK